MIDKLQETNSRLWYAQKTLENGWSREILSLQIDGSLHKRQGKAVHNFAVALPPADSDMASQVFKDPYLFDFLGTADARRECEVEQALTDHIMHFLPTVEEIEAELSEVVKPQRTVGRKKKGRGK